jgi:hypothetical protein
MAAGNEWIYSYLEAILDTGERINDSRKQTALGEKDSFKAAKYFVDEVTGFDESSLYRTWIKVNNSLFFVHELTHSLTSFLPSFPPFVFLIMFFSLFPVNSFFPSSACSSLSFGIYLKFFWVWDWKLYCSSTRRDVVATSNGFHIPFVNWGVGWVTSNSCILHPTSICIELFSLSLSLSLSLSFWGG